MEKYTTASGTKVLSTVMAFGEASLVTLILANGVTQRLKVSVYIPGKMGIDTRANGNSVSSTGKAPTYLRTAILTLVNTRKASLMARGNILGKMDLSM